MILVHHIFFYSSGSSPEILRQLCKVNGSQAEKKEFNVAVGSIVDPYSEGTCLQSLLNYIHMYSDVPFTLVAGLLAEVSIRKVLRPAISVQIFLVSLCQ